MVRSPACIRHTTVRLAMTSVQQSESATKVDWAWRAELWLLDAQDAATTLICNLAFFGYGRFQYAMLPLSRVRRSKMSRRMARQARRHAAGRAPGVPNTPWQVMLMRLWMEERVFTWARTRAYVESEIARCDAQNPNWYNDELFSRDYCSECGQTWKYDSLVLCTDCAFLLGPCCAPPAKERRWRDGTRVCTACLSGTRVG